MEVNSASSTKGKGLQPSIKLRIQGFKSLLKIRLEKESIAA